MKSHVGSTKNIKGGFFIVFSNKGMKKKLISIQQDYDKHIGRITRLQALIQKEESKLFFCMQEEKRIQSLLYNEIQ